MSARRGTSSWCITAGLLRIFSALSPAPMDIAGMEIATESQLPPPAPVEMMWVQERRSDLELAKRLHKSTNDLDLSRVFVEGFVELIQDTATQSCCSPLYVGFTVIPIIGAAAGPDVSACAWHEGSAGYMLKLASMIMIAGASGTGKSNAARVHLTASATFEEKTGTRVVSTDFTNASLKTRMFECRQALVILEEARGPASTLAAPRFHISAHLLSARAHGRTHLASALLRASWVTPPSCCAGLEASRRHGHALWRRSRRARGNARAHGPIEDGNGPQEGRRWWRQGLPREGPVAATRVPGYIPLR